MLIRNRPDGRPIKVPGFTKLMPMLSGSRTKSTIFFEQELFIDGTMDFIVEYNRNRREGTRRLSILQVFLCAIARTVGEKPKMNRFVINYRYYQRNHISTAFVTKTSLEEDAEEVNIIISLDPDETIDSTNTKFTDHVNNIKTGGTNTSDKGVDIFSKLPAWLLRFIVGGFKFLDNHNLVTGGMLRAFPFYATVFLANLGSIQLDHAFHHLFDMGTNGIFIAIGKVKKEKFIADDDSIHTRRKLAIAFSYDDRIIDGLYAGKAIRLMKKYIEHPEMLCDRIEFSPEKRAEIGLTSKGSKLFA